MLPNGAKPSRRANVIAHVWGLALICLVFASCAPTKEAKGPGVCEHVYFVSSGFDDLERERIERANDRWNVLGTAQTCLAPGENVQGGVKRIEYQGPEWQELSRQFGGLNVLGVYRRATDSITIVSGLPLDTFELVALHELGHARGLAHVTGGPAVMNAGIGAASDFTVLDVAECQRVGACSGLVADQADAVGADVYVFVGL